MPQEEEIMAIKVSENGRLFIRRRQVLTGNILLMHFRRKFREVVSVISVMI